MLSLILLAALAPAWAVREGESAPDLSLPSLSGDTIALSSSAGKVVALVFWATWSKNASTELKELENLERELGPKGFTVLAVNEREDASQVAEFADRHQLSLTMLLDDGDGGRVYGVSGLPDLWVVDRDRTLKAHCIGYSPSDLERIRTLIEKSLTSTGREEKPSGPGAAEPSPALPPKLRAYAHLQIGAAHINIGDAFVKAGYRDYGHFDDALQEFRAGVALDPDNPDLYIWLGLALERKNDPSAAAREYQTALRLDPTNAYAQDCLRRLGIPWAPAPKAQ
jgi:peroxiredoxin